MQMRWVKIDDFRQITDYTLKTVKDRHIVSITVVMDVSRHVGLWGRAWRVWSLLELSQLSMCTDWPGAATCRLVRYWNRSNLAPGSAHSSITWWSRDRQVWTCAHVPRGNWWRDQLSWRCGGALLAPGSGHASAIKTRAQRQSGRTEESDR